MDANEILNSKDKKRIIDFLKTKNAKELLIAKSNFFQYASFFLNGEYLKYLYDSYGFLLLNKLDSDEINSRVSSMLNSKNKDYFLNKDEFLLLMVKYLSSNQLLKIGRNKRIITYLLDDEKFKKYLNKKSKTSILLNLKYSDVIEILSKSDINEYDLFSLLRFKDLFNWIIKNKHINIKDLSIDELLELTNSGLIFPQYLIDDNDFINYITNQSDILKVRNLIILLSKNNDTSKLEEKRKKYYEKEFISIKDNMTQKYKEFYDKLFSQEADYSSDYFQILYSQYFDENNRDNYYYSLNTTKFLEIIYYNPNRSIEDKKRIIKEELEYISSRLLTNMIIDYHFEEYYTNVFADIKELLSFSMNGGTQLPNDKFQLYYKILKMDDLSLQEKLKLHEELKKKNIITMFYDDMSEARNLMNEMISNYVLTKETIKEHINKEKSKKYGVDIYDFNGQEFFAIVKVGERKITSSKEKRKKPFGHSFSIIGTHGIGTFGDPKSVPNYIYDGLRKEQIVHVFPYDSFTAYDREKRSSNSVRTLMTPKELIDSSAEYNEILILEKGTSPSEMDEYIPELRKIAVYCYNKITPEDIEKAKKYNIGIMLINTNEYKFGSNNTVRDISFYEYEYYNGDNRFSIESKRKEFTKL